MSGADVPPLEKEKSAPDAPHSKENAAEIDEFGLPIRKIESSNSTEIKDGDVPSIAPPQDPAAETPHAKKQNGPPEQKKEHPISRPDGTPSNEYNSALRTHSRNASQAERSAQSAQDGDTRNRSDSHKSLRDSIINHSAKPGHISIASEWSHQQLAPQPDLEEKEEEEEQEKWETMPAYAPFDLYNDDGKLIAKEQVVENEDMDYGKLGGAGKGYTRVQVDDDAQSATSMDENTAYLFKEPTTNLLDEDEEGRDVMTQMQATKDILTEGQRIAYVGIVRLAMIQMLKEVSELERTRHTKKAIDFVIESTKMWSQKIMVRLYSHMEIESAGKRIDTRLEN